MLTVFHSNCIVISELKSKICKKRLKFGTLGSIYNSGNSGILFIINTPYRRTRLLFWTEKPRKIHTREIVYNHVFSILNISVKQYRCQDLSIKITKEIRCFIRLLLLSFINYVNLYSVLLGKIKHRIRNIRIIFVFIFILR